MSDRQPIGIDFGTTKTLASRWEHRNQRPVPIRLGRGTDEMPTTVHVDRTGNYTFGEDAEDQRVCEPGGYFPRIKRELERPTTHTLPTGQIATSIDLIASFLGNVRIRIEELHGSVGHTVITIPALYLAAARADLKAAAVRAGFEDFVLLEEPIAGGSAFLYDAATSFSGRNFAVFDWGGGTLDLAIIERNGGALKAYPDLIGGDPELGGEDIDDLIGVAISKELSLRGMRPLERQPDDIQIRAIGALVVCKQLLSRKQSHIFRLNLLDGTGQMGSVEFEWTRKQFEDFIVDEVGKAITQLTRLLAKSRSAGVKVDAVLLIGGTSEIPYVKQRIEEATQLTALRYDYGQSAVGLGAMLQARSKTSGNPAISNPVQISTPGESSIPIPPGSIGAPHSSDLQQSSQPMLDCERCGIAISQSTHEFMNGCCERCFRGQPEASTSVRGNDIRLEYPVYPVYPVAPDAGLERRYWFGTKRIDFTVPQDFEDGQTLRLCGEGEMGKHGGPSGDLIIILKKTESKASFQQQDSNPSNPVSLPVSGKSNDVLAIIGGITVLALVIGGICLLFTGLGIPVGLGFFWVARLIFVAINSASSKK